MIAYLCLIVAIAGLLCWFVSSNAKIQEAGRIAFFCGLLGLCIAFAQKMVAVLH